MAFNFNKSGNPVLSDRLFKQTEVIQDGSSMTLMGTMNKFGFLFLMVLGSASFTWHLFDSGKLAATKGLMIGGVIVGLVLAIVIAFKPRHSYILAPLYGLAEGFFLGGVSAIFNQSFEESYPNIITHAIGLTFGVVLAMFSLYYFKVIKVTQQLRSIIIMATMGIFLFYLLSMVLGLFGIPMRMVEGSGTFGIIFSVVVVGIAALNLLLDFAMIEELADKNAPKYMEWYGAFALLVTIVWLYIEILKLLSKLAARRD